MAYLQTLHGVRVSVDDDKVDRLLASGSYTRESDAGSKSAHASKNVAALREEIERRNEGRDEADLLSLEGKKADLVAVLDADDAAADE
jgi:hypothetical protein